MSLVERLRELVNGFAGYSMTHHDIGSDLMSSALEAAERIEAMAARILELEAQQRWIPVSERLPDSDEHMQIVWCNGDWEFAFWVEDAWDCPDKGWLNNADVTHWMPPPEPPEGEQ